MVKIKFKLALTNLIVFIMTVYLQYMHMLMIKFSIQKFQLIFVKIFLIQFMLSYIHLLYSNVYEYIQK